MSFKLLTPSPAHLSAPELTARTANAATSPDDEKRAKDAAKVGRDFEAILVRQMLSQAKIAGKGGYADMAVESLATSVTAAGGLGMGKAIEQSLLASGHVAHTAAPLNGPHGALPAAASAPVSPANLSISQDKTKLPKK